MRQRNRYIKRQITRRGRDRNSVGDREGHRHKDKDMRYRRERVNK